MVCLINMPKILIKKISQRDGQALILGYITIAFLAVLSSSLFDKIVSEKRILERQGLEREAFYLAEGGMEDAINQFTAAIANFQIQPDIARYPALGTITTVYSNSSPSLNGAQANSVITEAETGMRPLTDVDGTAIGVKTFIVNSACRHPANNAISVTLNQAIVLRLTYAFQYAVFYNDDLEMSPGPPMNLSGKVHGNKDMYLDTWTKFTINNEYVRSAGSIYNKAKADPNLYKAGEVRIKKTGSGDFLNMNMKGSKNYSDVLDSNSPNWLTESQSRWNGTVQSSAHGVTKLSTPEPGSIQPNGYYAKNANIVIENGTIMQGGKVLEEGKDIPKGTIVTDNYFYNNREGKFIQMTSIDLKKLAGYASECKEKDKDNEDDKDNDKNGDEEDPCFDNYLPGNGLIYATRNDVSETQQPGIRLINGSEIYRDRGLTVVSDAPLYIQGDYNVTNKKPAAVICDAINILSNSWEDTNSIKSLKQRKPSDTEINAAFIAGVDETTPGNYNGGLENYPRFHEDWVGSKAKVSTIRGSFVQLWKSQIAQGKWIYGGPQYEAPNRNWGYDTDFNDLNKLPPFTPFVAEAQRSAWWKD